MTDIVSTQARPVRMCHEGDVRSIDEQNDSKCQNYNKTVPVTFNLCTTLYQASGANRTFSHNANNSVCCNVHRYYVYTIAYWRIRRRPTDSTGPEGCTYMKNMITRLRISQSQRSRNRPLFLYYSGSITVRGNAFYNRHAMPVPVHPQGVLVIGVWADDAYVY